MHPNAQMHQNKSKPYYSVPGTQNCTQEKMKDDDTYNEAEFFNLTNSLASDSDKFKSIISLCPEANYIKIETKIWIQNDLNLISAQPSIILVFLSIMPKEFKPYSI